MSGMLPAAQHGKLRAGLVVSEVAFSILLLIGAGLLMRSFLVLTRVDLGFNPKNVLYFRLDPTMYAQVSDRRIKQNILTRRLLNSQGSGRRESHPPRTSQHERRPKPN